MSTRSSPSSSLIAGMRPVGRDALLLEVRSPDDVPAIAAAVSAHLDSPDPAWSAGDVVPAARTVLVTGLTQPLAVVARDIGAWTIPPLPANAGPLVTLPVVYDGPDLGDVAGLWGTTADAVATQLRQLEFRVAFSGFAPGFGYLTGLPQELAVPRRDTPRTRVPAGSVGMAGRYVGAYPRVSPGGWQLVGTVVDIALWDAERDPPALLMPGTRVRFTDA